MTGNAQLTDEQIVKVKSKLTEWGLLDPNFASTGDPRIKVMHSNRWNDYCVSGAESFLRLFDINDADGIIDQKEVEFILSKGAPFPLNPQTPKERKIVKAYTENDWYVARGNDVFNILWIEDINRDWTARKGLIDKWDDMVLLWQAEHNGKVRIIEEFYQCTTEPGAFYTYKPMNIKGAARIAFGQYKAWQRGLHGSGRTAHQGFRQEAPIRVFRDLNQDGSRAGDETDDGIFFCNIHSTIDGPDGVGRWGAGCSVFRFMQELRRFMSFTDSDRRYLLNKAYMYIGAYIHGDDIAKY